MNALWTSRGTPLRPVPFGMAMDWFRYFLTQDPKFDGNTVTPAAYERLWDQSVEQYGIVIGTDNPDLTAFRDRGGKAIVWHGWADQLITAEGTHRLLHARAAADGWREEDVGIHPPVHGARCHPLRRRRGSAADGSDGGAARVGRRRQGAGDAAGRRGAIRPAPSRGRGRCAPIRSSRSTRAAAARTMRPTSRAAPGSEATA